MTIIDWTGLDWMALTCLLAPKGLKGLLLAYI